MDQKPLHIISHTDLDGVVAAAVAWHASFPEEAPLRVSLVGYGDVDALVLETLRTNLRLRVLDLFCQRQDTIDHLDTSFQEGSEPFFFDHHKTTEERFGNRPWAVLDPSCCAAMVYHRWALERAKNVTVRGRLEALSDMVVVANDRDLWLGQDERSRLWQALVTLCTPWGVLMRLVANPSPVLSSGERQAAESFVERQERRFSEALEKVVRRGQDLTWVGPDLLEFGDVSDFCGLVLDRLENPPRLVAVAHRRPAGDWAVSLRSRDAFAARLVGLLKDGKKIRGGGHDDAAAVYFPASYREIQVQDAVFAALRMTEEQGKPLEMSLGDLFRQKDFSGKV